MTLGSMNAKRIVWKIAEVILDISTRLRRIYHLFFFRVQDFKLPSFRLSLNKLNACYRKLKFRPSSKFLM